MSITDLVNQRILDAMQARGIRRAALARLLGVTRETVSIALNDPHRDWKICTLEEWAHALGCELVIELRPRSQAATTEADRIAELEAWIRSEGERTDICTFPVLHEVCAGCRCGKEKATARAQGKAGSILDGLLNGQTVKLEEL